jgi:hypothetical protein
MRTDAGKATLAAALLLIGCRASAPLPVDGAHPPGNSPCPTIASCTPPVGSAVPACPGPSCQDNAIGPPDGKVADLGFCAALDLVFGDGTVFAPDDTAQPALEVTLGRLGGATRVDAFNGKTYTNIGYIVQDRNSLPFTIADACLAKLDGLTARLTLSRCQGLAQTTSLRLSADDRASGSASIDAVRALSFKPAN